MLYIQNSSESETSNDGEINSQRGAEDKKSDCCVSSTSQMCVGVFLIHRSSAEECVSPEDKGEAIVCDVAYQNKSAGFCPADPSPFFGTDVTISNFKVC